MNNKYFIGCLAVILCLLPLFGVQGYPLHIIITILIWSFAYTGWSIMGRFGLVSLGHGAFMAMGGYITALLWNYLGMSPWLGIPIALVITGILAIIVAYPCFKFRIVGHYFALVTLALSEVVRQVIIATRDYTGGSLGYTPEPHGEGWSIYAIQFPDDRIVFLYIAIFTWLVGIIIWKIIDGSMSRYALEAISEDEDASSAIGVKVTNEKLKITVLSAIMTAFAGALYCQYQMFISPDTIGGVGISLQIVFAVVVGGIYSSLGPTVGAVITLILAEMLRISIGTATVNLTESLTINAAGFPLFIYGIMLVGFIIFLPKGIVGGLSDLLSKKDDKSLNIKSSNVK